MKSVTGIKRGCGTRQVGGLYACCGLSPYGKPIEHFIIDPPVFVEYKNFRAPILVDDNLLFWVGEKFYPYPSDFIEEARIYGVSKRIPVNFPLERINSLSKMYFVHPKAIIENFKELPAPIYCPKNYDHHLTQGEYCIGYSYSLAYNEKEGEERKVGDITYMLYPFKQKFEVEPIYKQGTFLALPITHFDFIVGKKYDENLIKKGKEIAERAQLPVNLEEE